MRRSVLAGLGLVLSVAGTAAAQQPQDGQRTPRPRAERAGQMDGRRGGADGLLLKGITLTEGQRTQIAQLRKSQMEQARADRQKNGDQREQVRAARERGDTVAVRKAVEARRQVMEQQRAQHVAAIRNLLTADQRVQFDKNVAALKERQAQRAERGPGDRGGKGMRGPRGPRAGR
jgi:Spy/CpxP family protein refolding chaperone